MVAVQSQLKQMLLNSQMSLLNSTYKTSGNQGIKNAAVSQLSNTVNQAETLRQEPKQTIYGTAQPTSTVATTKSAAPANDQPALKAGKVELGNVQIGKSKADVSNELKLGDKTKGRSKADFERDVRIIADLKAEFGGNLGKDKDWIKLARKSDKVTIYDKSGTKNIENTGLTKASFGDGEQIIGKGNILEVQSQKYGTVKISVGGDGIMNGRDDVILSIGSKAAANSVQTGIAKALEAPEQPKVAAQQEVIYEKATCPICKGAGCPQCGVPDAKVPAQAAQTVPTAQPQSQSLNPLLLNSTVLEESKQIIANHKPETNEVNVAKFAEARDLAATSEVQKLAGKNDEVAELVGKTNNPYSLDKDQVNNLIAALMLIIGGYSDFK